MLIFSIKNKTCHKNKQTFKTNLFCSCLFSGRITTAINTANDYTDDVLQNGFGTNPVWLVREKVMSASRNNHNIDIVDNIDGGPDNSTLNSFRVGWYYSPKEHVDIATKLEHPCESDAAFPDDLKVALFNILTKGLHAVAKERTELLREMINRANDLRDEESRFKKTLDPEVADVVKHKRLLLFRWLLDAISLEDPVLIDHMEKGVKLVGSPLYPRGALHQP